MEAIYYLGIMSGTSLDGIDLALMDFSQNPPKLTAWDYTSMPEPLRTDLSTLIQQGGTSLQTLGELDHRLGLLYAECVNRFLSANQLKPEQICAIGCHGQTVWHAPCGRYPFTSQIGDMNLLAARTQIDVIADFRRKDMAFGGQGAPLVPAFHQAFFARSDKIVGVLNIGGISNISLLIPEKTTIGYDIGAGNTLMDAWVEQHLGIRFDRNGEWAKSGKVNVRLLTDLLDEAFFQQPAPKSTGRELFNLDWLAKKLANHSACKPEDVQATLLEFTAQSIANALADIENPMKLPCELLLCGGGAKNRFLVERLNALCADWTICSTNKYGLDIDFVEAAAFAWLAYRRINALPSNLPSVTGARQAVSLGVIYPH